MSIYATWLSIEDIREEAAELRAAGIGFGVIAEGIEDPEDEQEWEQNLDSTEFDAPIIYKGSHVLPKESDVRGGLVSVAAIPNHIQRSIGPCPLAREHTYRMLPGSPDIALRMKRIEDCPHGCDLDGLLLSPEQLHDFLRLDLKEHKDTYHGGEPGMATVVLTRSQVERLRDVLTQWLEAKERG